MKTDQLNQLDNLRKLQEKLSNGSIDYWKEYSNIDTWQFWVNVSMLVVPLIILFIFIDRQKAFHLGFFGYSIHVYSGYIDGFGTRHGYWEYPFQAIPILPISFALDTSLIPVVFMLLYQWTLNNNKNYYLYAFLVCAIFSFVFKPIMSALSLIRLENGANFFHLFLAFIVGSILAKWITNLFLYFEKGR
ncbi:CBO0543 family protein [Bacillus sp. DJP31]|uniref:CBO0543 family protein n=1 Tax=Bacillus sp. DJP31 TaxID=3409789 RepID=UPI003BB6E8C9